MLQIATEKEILSFYQEKYSHRKRKMYAFYNSLFNKIILDQKYMLIPADDRIAVRGHGCFDSIINLDSHVDRLFNSAKMIQIYPKQSKQQVKNIIFQLMRSVMRKYILQNGPNSQESLQQLVVGIRMIFSSGFGDFGIASLNKQPIFYAIAFQPYIDPIVQENGVNDYVVKFVKQISSEMVHAKTTNYLQNAIMANESKKKGGYVGIKAFQTRVLLEASIANISFIFGKQFATPRFETVINGTTLKNLLKYLQILKQQGMIQKVSFRDITIEQAYKADEMIILGGDKIVPVLNLDDHPIGNKKVGKFARMFQKWYAQTNLKLYPIVY